jgi:hypothetical protein
LIATRLYPGSNEKYGYTANPAAINVSATMSFQPVRTLRSFDEAGTCQQPGEGREIRCYFSKKAEQLKHLVSDLFSYSQMTSLEQLLQAKATGH